MTKTETNTNVINETVIKDKTYTLTENQLIDLKRQFKDIRLGILPCYGTDSKSIGSHLDSLDLLIDLYLKRIQDDA